MGIQQSFLSKTEEDIGAEFLESGFVIRPVDDREALDELRAFMVSLVCKHLGEKPPPNVDDFLNHIERIVPVEKLNDLRLSVYRAMNTESWLRPTYYSLARSTIEVLVGNELAMQKPH